ncbi:MAG TPA: hypothetical protein V6D17_14145 [Candidatus Obscuribacterales bacterium]
MIRILVAALLMLVLRLSVFAQEQRTEVVQKLYELTQDVLSSKITPVRGGTKEKPLGCYFGAKSDIQFRSGYKDVEPRTQCEWAYDLHQFIVQNGGGWENFQRYLKEAPVENPLDASLRSYAGGRDAKDPFDRAHVPYDKQAAFADGWWKKNSRAYSTALVPPKDWWIHDAIVDGNNLWTRYELLAGNGSSDFVSWRDSELARLLDKK